MKPHNRKRMWEIKQLAESPEALDVYIYGDVEEDGYDWWTDEVIKSETSAEHFRTVLADHPDVSQINIYINSYGGSVFEGTSIYNQLRRHQAKKTAYIDGFACSIASVIAMAADEVVIPKNALMMIHNPWTIAMGNASELRKMADDLEVIGSAGRQAYLQKAGGKLEEKQLIEMMDAETWLTADQCIEYGLADRYADADADMSNATAILQKANLNLEQRINVQKTLAAQLRELTKPPAKEPESKTKQNNEPNQTGNKLMNLLSGFSFE